jgi:hypothetical protein
MKIFSEVNNFDKETIKVALGEFGESFYEFSKDLDLDHFGIDDIPIDNDLSKKIINILKLIKFALDNGLDETVFGISNFYKKDIPLDIKNIDKKFIRLIKNKEKRESLRNNKKICDISLIKFYEKARVVWDNLPEDFSLFTKYSTKFDQILIDAEVKAKRYKELGCDELYKNIIDSVENTKKIMTDIYQGYHRVSLINAAIILAKINRFELSRQEFFEKQNYIISLNKSIYKPKIYPIRYLNQIMPDQIRDLMFELEKNPFFDYYMVLVPSTHGSNQEKDINDIKNKNTIPVLVGEKDGNCYFISYWI